MLSRVVLTLLLLSVTNTYGFLLTVNRVKTGKTGTVLYEKKNYSISTKKTLQEGYRPPSQGFVGFVSGAINAVKKTVAGAYESVTHPPSTDIPMAMVEPIQSKQQEAAISAPVVVPSPTISETPETPVPEVPKFTGWGPGFTIKKQ